MDCFDSIDKIHLSLNIEFTEREHKREKYIQNFLSKKNSRIQLMEWKLTAEKNNLERGSVRKEEREILKIGDWDKKFQVTKSSFC